MLLIKTVKIRIILKSYTIAGILDRMALAEQLIKLMEPPQDHIVPNRHADLLPEQMGEVGFAKSKVLRHGIHADLLCGVLGQIAAYLLNEGRFLAGSGGSTALGIG